MSLSATPDLDFRTLFEAAPGLYLVLSPDFTVIAVSDAYLRATRTVREEILGRNIFQVFPDNPNDPAATGVSNLRSSLEHVRSTRQPDTMAVQKYDIRKPDSEGGGFEERHWSPMNWPVLKGGELISIIHRVEDVTAFVHLQKGQTEQSKVTAELRARVNRMASEVVVRAQEVQDASARLRAASAERTVLYERLQRLDELKTQFFSNVSHELRTPLTLILGPVSRLLSEGGLSPGQRETLEVAVRNARTLLRQVNDLLDLSKLDAGKMAARYVETDVAQLVRQAASDFDSLATDRQVRWEVDAPEALAAQLDRDKIERVLLNLIVNAFKHTPGGGSVRCELREVDGRALITVSDSGPGIPADEREAVFERFFQVAESANRRTGGTGLGLAIAKDFVELHRGRIRIGDSPEGGALLIVDLPLLAPDGAPVQSAESARDSSAGDLALASLEAPVSARPAPEVPTAADPRALVLVVEDNVDMSRYVREVLAPDYRVLTAPDGEAGLGEVLRVRPDLVVSDVMMPRMNGDELVRAVRTHHDLDSMPILMLTAKADDEFRVRLLREGAQDFLVKPFAPEELQARAGNLVARRRAEAALRSANASAESANRELEAFSYSVAHDLRAPLRAIDGFSSALEEDFAPLLNEAGKGYLNNVRTAARVMAQLIDGLLALSRVTRQDLAKAPVDLTQVARQVGRRLQESTPSRRVELTVHDGLRAQGDPRLLTAALENLMGNAWKFTGGRESAHVEVGAQEEDGATVFFVRDDGAGFDMAYADKLFGAFQRLHRQEEFEGTGIGLATVQRIISRHGGSIRAESARGRGATFYFTL